jgi:MOSC domain-containing protein YiiM
VKQWISNQEMTGIVVQVNVSPGGVPKRAVLTGIVTLDGLVGDSWGHPQIHGGPLQKILLLAEEVIDELKQKRFPVFPGALGENLTTRGIHPNRWRAGQVWRAGTARLELTKVRTPCNTIKVYGSAIHEALFDARVQSKDISSPLWGYSGFYARVVTEGAVQPGDPITLESERA